MKKRYIFGLGALVGGVAALLLTPKSGKEMQAQLLQNVEDLQQKVKEFDQDAFKEKCKEQLEEIKASINEFDWSHSVQQLEEKVSQLTGRLQELKTVIEDHQVEEMPSLRLHDELEDIEMLET
ncbi:MAG: YtxH domain-containing protein, partial [Turicibacter sanguinis]